MIFDLHLNPRSNAMNTSMSLAPRITIGSDNVVAVDGRPLRYVEFDILQRKRELRVAFEGDRFAMLGGKHGAHSLAAQANITTAERLLAHWSGYVTVTAPYAKPEHYGVAVAPSPTAPPTTLTTPVAFAPAAPALVAREPEPGDRIEFMSASAHKGWRTGTVIRVTPKRVLIEYSFKYDIERARRTGEPPRRHQTWKSRKETRNARKPVVKP